MADVFDKAVDGVFARFCLDAAYTPVGGVAVAVKVLAARPDVEISGFGQTRHKAAQGLFEVRAVEVAAPAKGDVLVVGGVTYTVASFKTKDPRRKVFILDCV